MARPRLCHTGLEVLSFKAEDRAIPTMFVIEPAGAEKSGLRVERLRGTVEEDDEMPGIHTQRPTACFANASVCQRSLPYLLPLA